MTLDKDELTREIEAMEAIHRTMLPLTRSRRRKESPERAESGER